MNVTLESLRSRLLAEPPFLPLMPTRGDYDLDPGNRPAKPLNLFPAAVLLPVVERKEPTVLFTERNANLKRHAGQVSFPGGRVEPDDVSLVQTALRETHEETGIESSFITVAGFLDAYETGTGYAVLPVVGLLSEGFALVPNTSEVANIFEVRTVRKTRWNGRGGCVASTLSATMVIISGAPRRRCW